MANLKAGYAYPLLLSKLSIWGVSEFQNSIIRNSGIRESWIFWKWTFSWNWVSKFAGAVPLVLCVAAGCSVSVAQDGCHLLKLRGLKHECSVFQQRCRSEPL